MNIKMKRVKDYPPTICPFKEGDTVEIISTLHKYNGLAKVEGVLLKWPKGEDEPAFCWSCDEPTPQVLLRLADGRELRMDGKDLMKRKIKATKKLMRPHLSLKKELERIIVDLSQANEDLGYPTESGNAKTTLYEFCKSILVFLKPLLNKKVYLEEELSKIELGEFDNYTFNFRACKEGQAMRNSGIPEFKLSITVDGYAPTVFSLEVSEIYYE